MRTNKPHKALCCTSLDDDTWNTKGCIGKVSYVFWCILIFAQGSNETLIIIRAYKKMKEISCEELTHILNRQKSALLCGNGFSINFDEDFANIYDRLYDAQKLLIRAGKFDMKGNRVFNKVFMDNYRSVVKFVRYFSEKDLSCVFIDGVCFAQSIIESQEVLEKLQGENRIHGLVFGKSELNLVENIARVGRDKGYKYINIEYWSILIYMYFAIREIDSQYSFPSNNDFITLIKLGNVNKNKLIQQTDDIRQFVLSNGFNSYYRMLLCITILSNGKAIDSSKLENIKYREFLRYFSR